MEISQARVKYTLKEKSLSKGIVSLYICHQFNMDENKIDYGGNCLDVRPNSHNLHQSSTRYGEG